MASVAPSYQEALHQQDTKAWDVGLELPLLLSIGICLFGLIVLARQRWRGAACSLSPGHWVLVVIGPFFVLEMMKLWIVPLLSAYLRSPWRVANAAEAALVVIVLAISIAVSLPALRGCEPRWRVCLLLSFSWLIAMGCMLAHNAAKVLGYWPSSLWTRHLVAIFSTLEILAAVAGAVAVAIDVTNGARRDWLHYFGIAALVLSAIEATFTWGKISAKWWQELFYHLLP
jgi:hypothetical protein